METTLIRPGQIVAPTRSAELQSQIQGTVITPDDARYDEARRAWNLSVGQHPALIVIAANATDVVEAVQFAADENLSVTVQSTGHGIVRPASVRARGCGS